MSKIQKEYWSNLENRKAHSKRLKKYAKEHPERYSKVWNKGLTKETDERVAKYAKSLIGHEGAFAGKKRPEHSKIMKGRKFTEEHKRKIKESNKNNPFVIHHINGNHFDDRPENRMKTTRSEHTKLHNEQRRLINGKNLLVE